MKPSIRRRNSIPAKVAGKGVGAYTVVKSARGLATRDRGASRRRATASGGALIAAAGAGAALAHFADRQNGRRRRHEARDRAFATLRRGKRDIARRADYAAGVAAGAAVSVAGAARSDEQPDDLVLKDKVQSTIFRAPGAPKDRVSVDVESSVVYLRGELDDAGQIRDLVGAAERVDGVEEVVSLLHTPGEPAPMKPQV